MANIKKNKKEKTKMICKTTVKGYGFSDGMIKKLLPEPKYVRNPYYSTADMMCLWEEKVVLDVMKTDAFKEAFARKVAINEKARKTKEKREEEREGIEAGFSNVISIETYL